MVAISPAAIGVPIEHASTGDHRPTALPFSSVFGVRLHHLTGSTIADTLRACVRSGLAHQFVTVNLDFLRIAHHHAEFRDVLTSADVAVADGMPVVWLSRLTSRPLPERLAGVDLVLAAAALSAREGYSLFLLGAAPGVATEAARALTAQHPGLTIAGTYAPPIGAWPAEENARILERIRAAKPDFLFVALGAPRQDLWIHEHLDELGVPVCVGVGCTFDIISGRNKRAPRWMQRSGLEWAYRLQAEPGRLWRRYLLADLPFFARAVSAHAMSIVGIR